MKSRFPRSAHARSGFSLIELVVVILIMTILAGVIVPRVFDRQAAARDARRMADLRAVRDAIEQYQLDHNVYPPAKTNASYGGWDVSQDGDFIPELVEKGYLRETPKDPTNDETYHYRYYVYTKASYGCVGETDFYVLGCKAFETASAKEKAEGYFKCASRDWGSEFDYVTGGGASFK